MSRRKDPCKKAACEIQKCLQLNSFNESKCGQEIEAMRVCCSKLGTQQSICCSGFQDHKGAEENLSGSSGLDSSKPAFSKS